MSGRRATLRAELFGRIRAAALGELRRCGAAELCLRTVAKTAGISPSGLYRYVDGRDGLLELLISDGFEAFGRSIGQAIEAAGGDPRDQLEAVALAYRRWALENPDQFGLILGTPVPGFRARADGPTTESVFRFGAPMVRVVAAAYWASDQAGEGSGAPDDDGRSVDPTTTLPASLKGLLARAWARLHGLVTLEVYGHLEWSGSDVEELLRAEARSILAEIDELRSASTR